MAKTANFSVGSCGLDGSMISKLVGMFNSSLSQ